MQCCEFEMVLEYFRISVRDMRTDRHYSRLELADILMDHGVTTIAQLPDAVSIARNLEAASRIRLVA